MIVTGNREIKLWIKFIVEIVYSLKDLDGLNVIISLIQKKRHMKVVIVKGYAKLKEKHNPKRIINTISVHIISQLHINFSLTNGKKYAILYLKDGEMTKRQIEQFLEEIRKSDGKIFSVHFIKRTTGELKKMVCRLGVKKGVKGVGLPYNPLSKGLLPVFDMQKNGFRQISLDNITYLLINGKRIV